MTESKRFSLNEADWSRWFRSTVEWLAPLGLIYFGQVALYLGDGFSMQDFVPNTVLLGALSLYIVNRFYDLSKKFAGGK